MILRNKLLQALTLVLVVMVMATVIFKVADMLPEHQVKITYSVGGEQRVYIVKSNSISRKTNSECITFTDNIGCSHTVCGTFETEIIK
jgi:hypothetical protein